MATRSSLRRWSPRPERSSLPAAAPRRGCANSGWRPAWCLSSRRPTASLPPYATSASLRAAGGCASFVRAWTRRCSEARRPKRRRLLRRSSLRARTRMRSTRVRSGRSSPPATSCRCCGKAVWTQCVLGLPRRRTRSLRRWRRQRALSATALCRTGRGWWRRARRRGRGAPPQGCRCDLGESRRISAGFRSRWEGVCQDQRIEISEYSSAELGWSTISADLAYLGCSRLSR
mmetsp:Transcript_18074/g.59552  ORF Transcript_18074/g.59552 Transcript_18074/m.59552 type:complete len:231 (+) Transcript_18074:341-1033(+)